MFIHVVLWFLGRVHHYADLRIINTATLGDYMYIDVYYITHVELQPHINYWGRDDSCMTNLGSLELIANVSH